MFLSSGQKLESGTNNDFEIGFHEANTAFVLEVMKSKSDDTFAGFYGICSEGYLFYLFLFFSRTRRRAMCHYIKKKKI